MSEHDTCTAGQEVRRGRQGRVFIVVCTLTLLGFALRMWNIDKESVSVDELACIVGLNAPDFAAFMAATNDYFDTPNAPVYPFLEFQWIQWFGRSVLSVRVLSVILGVAAIPGLYLLARRLCGVHAALITTFCFAVSPYTIYYAQETRFYALVPLLAILSIYTLVIFISTQGNLAALACHVGANALLAWSYPLGPGLAVTEGIFLVLFYSHLRAVVLPWAVAHAFMMVAFLLWLRSQDLDSAVTLHLNFPRPFIEILLTVLFTPLLFSGALATKQDLHTEIRLFRPVDIALIILTYGVILWMVWQRAGSSPVRRPAHVSAVIALFKRVFVYPAYAFLSQTPHPDARQPSDWVHLLLTWLFLPLAIDFAIWFVFPGMLFSRYVMYSCVAFYILVGAAISAIKSPSRRFLATLALVLLYAGEHYALAGTPHRPDWRAAGQYYKEHRKPTDWLIVQFNLNGPALEFNAGIPQREFYAYEEDAEIIAAVERGWRLGRDVWLMSCLWHRFEVEDFFRKTGVPFSYRDFPGWPDIRVYFLPAASAPPLPPAESNVSALGNRKRPGTLAALGQCIL